MPLVLGLCFVATDLALSLCRSLLDSEAGIAARAIRLLSKDSVVQPCPVPDPADLALSVDFVVRPCLALSRGPCQRAWVDCIPPRYWAKLKSSFASQFSFHAFLAYPSFHAF